MVSNKLTRILLLVLGVVILANVCQAVASSYSIDNVIVLKGDNASVTLSPTGGYIRIKTIRLVTTGGAQSYTLHSGTPSAHPIWETYASSASAGTTTILETNYPDSGIKLPVSTLTLNAADSGASSTLYIYTDPR
jgi:hypothetical protein